MDSVIKFMTKKLDKQGWGLKLPKLILSVTGGAIYEEYTANTKKIFFNALYRTVKSTDTWIISGGTNAGVMRLVGEAAKNSQVKYNKDLTVIGIATWGVIDNEPILKNKLQKEVDFIDHFFSIMFSIFVFILRN